MSEVSATPPPAQESNSARKKRERTETAAKASAGSATPVNGAEAESSPVANGESDNAYIKELTKQIRNINKKLNGTAKADAIIAENPNKSLDELVASKKINADQKAQLLKKPALQTQLAQIEEQLTQYRKIDSEYQGRLATEKQASEDKFAAELAAAREQATKEAEEKAKAVVKQKLLLFSQFLRAAAAKRVIEEEADTEESKAFEGALLLVYGGDDKAVEAAENIVEGSDDFVPSVEGQLLNVKYSQLHKLTLESAPYIPEEQWTATVTETSDAVAAEAAHINVDTESDPTVAHAGLTELGLNQSSTLPVAEQTSALPAQTSAADDSANLAAQTTEAGSEASYEIVPREPENPSAANGSWADDSAEAAATAAATKAAENDGFHEVQGRNRGRGGHRGDGRGRGRGGFRGEGRGRGGFRGRGGEGRGGRGRGQAKSS